MMWDLDFFKCRHIWDSWHAHQHVLCILPQEKDFEACAAWLRFLGYQGSIRFFPSWGTSPYDRAAPDAMRWHERMWTLAHLHEISSQTITLSTPEALMHKLAPPQLWSSTSLELKPSMVLTHDDLQHFLHRAGYVRTSTVYEPGEYCLRGSIVDLYAPGPQALRLDFFGDTLESIRTFDPFTQRSEHFQTECRIFPARDVVLTPETVRRFRNLYRQEKGHEAQDHPLYQSVSASCYMPGLESFLPLFYETLGTFFDVIPASTQIITCGFAEIALQKEWQNIQRYDMTRHHVQQGDASTQGMIPPTSFYLTPSEVGAYLQKFEQVEIPLAEHTGVMPLREISWWESFREHEKVVVACASSQQNIQRIQDLGATHGLVLQKIQVLDDAHKPGCYVTDRALPDQSFKSTSSIFVTEQDLLGTHSPRPSQSRKTPEALLLELTALKKGDHVVHQAHGIGRYEGLVTLTLQNAAHECCDLRYEGNDKLFVPVEHLHLLSRYGGADAAVTLDRLGSAAWQGRKARIKKRLQMMAEQLIQLAAQRTHQTAPSCCPPLDAYEAFCAQFPYVETEDQQKSIHDVLQDLASGRPMDRIVCGDVGFGKTEVAMRAAFAVVSQGLQVVVICPTTLLCRQHALNFQQRFQHTPYRVGQISRMVSSQETQALYQDLAEGNISILVTTHAVLNPKIKFQALGLVILDEEQHFGVAHKEKFKALQSHAHLLTLTATPIPRTLHMALSGIRALSLVRTPPIDRMAVRTVIGPWELSIVIHALTTEKERKGQSFLVAPHIEDLSSLQTLLKKHSPQLHTTLAHGQMKPKDIEKAMMVFSEGQTDVLIATSIVESGLDISRANTLIVYKADHFGLSQLYQLRGRVGRSGVQACAYLTYETEKIITKDAQKRLNVMRTLDHLGASFMLAHHDMDIRGTGNLLGAEQSGHIREVGIELYQSMLSEAVQIAQGCETTTRQENTPTLNVGLAILIPETYIADLDLRLQTYRSINQECMQGRMIEARTMLIDRFGPLPIEVDHLLRLMDLQRRCLALKIAQVDAGPRGALVSFWNDQPPAAERLVTWAQKHHPVIKMRPDHRLVYNTPWPDAPSRLKGLEKLAAHLESILL